MIVDLPPPNYDAEAFIEFTGGPKTFHVGHPWHSEPTIPLQDAGATKWATQEEALRETILVMKARAADRQGAAPRIRVQNPASISISMSQVALKAQSVYQKFQGHIEVSPNVAPSGYSFGEHGVFYLKKSLMPMKAMQAYFECGWTDTEIHEMVPTVTLEEIAVARDFIKEQL